MYGKVTVSEGALMTAIRNGSLETQNVDRENFVVIFLLQQCPLGTQGSLEGFEVPYIRL